MIIKLKCDMPINGVMSKKNSEHELDPHYAVALLESGRALRVKKNIEVSDPVVTETAAKPKKRKKKLEE